jgi:hypothetical protein
VYFLVPDEKVYIPGAGKCIYCPPKAPEADKLEREHIISHTLGGKLILHNASCRDCSSLINREIENPCLKQFWLAPRTHLDLPTSNPRTTLRIGTWDDTGDNRLPENMTKVNFKFEKVPVDEHPGITFLPVFQRPRILLGNPPSGGVGPVGFWNSPIQRMPKAPQGKRAADMQPFAIGPIARMIAKIAHGVAVAELGLGAFEPLLPDIIMGRSDHIFHLVGNISKRGRKRIALHRITLELEQGFIVANVQLFARLRGPIFQAVVGRPDLSAFKNRESEFIKTSAAPA